MSTGNVLSETEIGYIQTILGRALGDEHMPHEAVIRAIEQAVLQSPEIQALRKDAERFEFLRDNTQLFSQFGEADSSGWCVMRRDSAIRRVFTYNDQELVEAIDAVRENKS